MHSTHTAFIAGHNAKGYVKVLKTAYNSPRPGMAKLSEVACPNSLQISKTPLA